ncbi:prolipoprotein diacylglyceryl transferase [Allosphingosinicella flava]|uniref:Phosphatidylglycerol--prolipoprotein diacylglyceryl transferase n=1 Tax=Allosphingosinicella flava TaxID=2771430 RepID=A0A7T2GJ65_9SPHN|nr:prolipoprotein diacylglyceryl transferase [Sphingosinicella flava]
MILTSLSAAVIDASSGIRWDGLGLDPIALDLGFFQLRWYSLAYLAGIVCGWWYMLKLIDRPGAPMARRHVDDLVFFVAIGVILGGRLGYVLFYRPEYYIANPAEIPQLWDGGMSFHGGVIGVSLGLLYLARKHGLNWLRVHDYVACCIPFGLFFGRLANFVNGELWGRETHVPWAVVFPGGGDLPRHPSQLYEAGLEGIALGLILWFLFWKTDARYQPGKLVGTFLLGYGISRFLVELVRQPDAGLEHLAWGLSMGQTLTVPMILGGLYLIVTAKGRRERVEPIAGGESIA